jgi:uncharacterized protein YndB with AHSA1/START domain
MHARSAMRPAGPVPADRELVITRVFEAPRSLVFQAWSRPEHWVHWYGPQGFTLTGCEVDFRPGGVWRKCMRSPEGADYWRWGVYKEIAEPERLVFTYVSDDRLAKPNHETLVTLTFEDLGTKTRMTLWQTGFDSVASRDGHEGGWTSCMERFADYTARLAAAAAKPGA